ncbi:MAG: DUF4860 domain-containing protein [Bacillota bacterium]|nr:DUF4860 domain-containing protein [Bacillota bacterium]
MKDILPGITIAVLFLVILLLVVFGATSYQHGAVYQKSNDELRVACSYITTSVKNSNGGRVAPTEFNGYPGILIEDGDTGFAHKIFLKDGALMEEYNLTGANVSPENAAKIGETSVFEINYLSDEILEVKTDIGTSYVHIGE